jgi:hypothetical protein
MVVEKWLRRFLDVPPWGFETPRGGKGKTEQY